MAQHTPIEWCDSAVSPAWLAMKGARLRLHDKGGDWSEWDPGLRVRQFPAWPPVSP